MNLKHELQQFSGCDVPIRHRLAPLLCFTDGVDHLRKAGHAYWLVDAIASYYGQGGRHINKLGDHFAGFHVWTLRSVDEGAVLVAAADTDEPALITQDIEYTDFPFDSDGEVKLYASLTIIGDEPCWMLMLPNEY